MVFCVSCQADVDLEYTDAGALSCCPQCGRVFEDIAFSMVLLGLQEVSFTRITS